jgi:hypothetical protein
MWNLFNCYLSGRHDYGMWCEPGAIFLRCIHCGKRSSGWAVIPKPALAVQCVPVTHARVAQAGPAPAIKTAHPAVNSHVLQFTEGRQSAKTGRVTAR